MGEPANVAAEHLAARLGSITLGLGAAEGYSGADLTNVRNAALAGEVPYLPVVPDGAAPADEVPYPPVAPDGIGPTADPVLELRIHGVGGAPSTDNLECPATLQVAGDGTAGFFRAWYPGGSAAGRPRREAYCWGGLNTRAASRALYLLLVTFMLVNVAHWALPARRTKRAPVLNALSRACLRLLGLALTVAFIATLITVLTDLVGWQAPAQGVLPTWLGWFSRRDDGPRMAITLLVVLAAMGLLVAVSVRTARSYEQWSACTYPDEDADWPLTATSFWRGDRAVYRQRNCHVAAASAEVILFAALPRSSESAVRVVALVLAGVIGLVAVGLMASPWADRIRIAGAEEKWADAVCQYFALGSAGLAVMLSVARFWWRFDASPRGLPGDQLLQVSVVFTQLALVLILGVLVVAQAPWKPGEDVMGFGMVAVLLAGLATIIATIFAGAFTLAIANVLGTPQVSLGAHKFGTEGDQTLYLPSIVYAGGIGMLAAIVMAVLAAAYALTWSRWERKRLARIDDHRDPDSVLSSYPTRGSTGSADAVARIWARSELTDHVASLLTLVVVPTAAFLAVDLISLQSGAGGVLLEHLAAIGGTLGVAATLYFFAQLRSALISATSRKRFGLMWDVGTFWPRACHPFAPPCYAERSVPEVVTRIRRIVGDEIRGTDGDSATAQEEAERRAAQPDDPREQHSALLLTGYSQGSPIAVAALAQLPAEVRKKVALLTLAAPVRRLYGRTFPGYFGRDQLATLRDQLSADGVVRWRNLVRRSDYIGGWVLDKIPQQAAGALVDREIFDPPVLWSDKDPSPPAAHLHSDLFPDPQTRPYAIELAGLLPPPDSPSAGLSAAATGLGTDRGAIVDG